MEKNGLIVLVWIDDLPLLLDERLKVLVRSDDPLRLIGSLSRGPDRWG